MKTTLSDLQNIIQFNADCSPTIDESPMRVRQHNGQ